MEVRALYLNDVTYKSAINYRQYTVKVFICGDYEFLSKMHGLSGASGMYKWYTKCKHNVK